MREMEEYQKTDSYKHFISAMKAKNEGTVIAALSLVMSRDELIL